MMTLDNLGYHWFCESHWQIMSFLFNKRVVMCSRDNGELSCERNHLAEIDFEEITLATIKYSDKFWDLCDSHLAIYDEIVGINMIYEYD